jgi:hypothetical protein
MEHVTPFVHVACVASHECRRHKKRRARLHVGFEVCLEANPHLYRGAAFPGLSLNPAFRRKLPTDVHSPIVPHLDGQPRDVTIADAASEVQVRVFVQSVGECPTILVLAASVLHMPQGCGSCQFK